MPSYQLAQDLRLPTNALDYTILAIYFLVVLGVGFAARRSIKTSLDFFLSGRSLPAWVTGLAFIAANLGALEILGMAANGAQYGVYTVHWYWVGAIPAMVFLGLVMMPFYYGSRVRSVPEFLLHRFGPSSHLLSGILFSAASVLIAGVNLYALAIVLEALLGWPQWVSIVVSGLFVLLYITLGGLSSAIYNEVVQFFVILAGLIPLTVLALIRVGGWSGLSDSLTASQGDNFVSAWGGTGIGSDNPLGANWLTIVLGLGFALSFGYWTTNFAEVQRALSAKNLSAAQRTPLIAAFPKIFIPAIVVIPGLVALVVAPDIGPGSGLEYNEAVPLLMRDLLPNGVLGIAVTGLLAAFMAGMAANVSAFNTVFTNDIWRPYLVKGRPDSYYVVTARVVTAIGVLLGMGTAFIAATFSNIMNYLQTLFSFFNVPLFTVFIIGMFWKRMTAAAGFWGLLAGTVAAMVNYFWFYRGGLLDIPTDQGANFVSAIVAFVVGTLVVVVLTPFTRPKPVERLAGLVYGTRAPGVAEPPAEGDEAWYRRPALLGWGAIILAALCYLPFSF
ncbi:sodium:solute symporter family protein [Streptomyces fenghuangensis]|uniref:sodium:solute symporter family protein n=1 Tax=Streptomyces sp. ICN903 TaxID=2964654 RepID=UPI001ED9FD97|nr:sodium:solute symporter family protein [Streptomyces sp. ICN903]MCG3042376.1 sodium:solute symporter family protein [Streptomyces sp. ICN903]